MKRDAASLAQIRAANPLESTWLAANAGSGKTRVLTDRVARLLLNKVLPENILCLTYTKAAATEMQNRLFKRLGGWAMLADDPLRAELAQLGVDSALSDGFLQDARTLFARAIETPGGLRIQTIHSFCASLLRRFPLEAGVSPQFQEMEDRAGELLRAEVLDKMASGPELHLVRNIAPFVSGDAVEGFLSALCQQRDILMRDLSEKELQTAYGLAEGENEETLVTRVFHPGDFEVLAELVPVLAGGGSTDQKLGQALSALNGPSLDSLQKLEQVLLTGDSAANPYTAKLGKIPTKAIREAEPIPDLSARLDSLMSRVEQARETRLALAAAHQDTALHAFGRAFVTAYEREKARRGWLDFDDLITRTRDLLRNPTVAAWVLYRLDGGIDHILVDEAQDTSPTQWDVIERLAQEFTSGDGARADITRTIFVVGDKKQSIYSFQGADPREFDRMRSEFSARLDATQTPLNPMLLEYSFRSAGPVLRVVDETFASEEASGFVPDQKHKAFKDRMPGRVDVWPLVTPAEKEEEGLWYEPVDRAGSNHHTVVLANRIAQFVKETIGSDLPQEIGQSGNYAARPAHAGDFLVLVRRRGPLFTEIIRACKQAGIPIAGADRLQIMTELAVRDVIALLRFLATPEDNLSLAAALRSPLFGISEQQLFDLSHRRTESYLWTALRRNRDLFPSVLSVLDDLRGKVDFLRPYDLIERILSYHKGRQLLIGRLGAEAEDGLNALLSQALAYEQSAVPSLTGFLEWAQTDDLQIKRAPDSAGRLLRVMTVHGAKGLEAPIVVLPDCGPRRDTIRSEVIRDQNGVFWKQGAKSLPKRQRDALDEIKAAEAREQDRLLYVGMTRAEKWLVVAAAGDLGKKGDSWYEKVTRGMSPARAVSHQFTFGSHGQGPGLRLEEGDWTDLPPVASEPSIAAAQDLPEMPSAELPLPGSNPETRSPSDLGGAKALPGAEGDIEDVAVTRGTVVHSFLESLAPIQQDQRARVADILCTKLSANPAHAGIVHLLPAIKDEALAVLTAPHLQRFFAPGSLAEIPVSAEIPGLGRIHGVIDRLVIEKTEVLALDFKSNRIVPKTAFEVPEGILRQMGAYRAALAQLYPHHNIQLGVIWTVDQSLTLLDHDIVTSALGRATTS